jgi:hypothetical protein
MAMGRALRRVTVAGLVAIGSLVLLSESAMAAPPSNDDVTGATAIAALPFTQQVDTTEATTTAEELAWNDYCGAPAMDHAVWYKVTPSADGTVTIDVTGSDYSAGILVLQGTLGDFTPVACAAGTVSGPVAQGGEYYFMIFGDDGANTGGTLWMNVREPVAPPEVAFTIDHRGTVDRQGGVTVTGTVTCTSPDGAGQVEYLFAEIQQPFGRTTVHGFGDAGFFAPCDGTPYPWTMQLYPNDGEFSGGKARLTVFAGACGTDQCDESNTQVTLSLKRQNNKP